MSGWFRGPVVTLCRQEEPRLFQGSLKSSALTITSCPFDLPVLEVEGGITMGHHVGIITGRAFKRRLGEYS